jgi:hypothetical protein
VEYAKENKEVFTKTRFRGAFVARNKAYETDIKKA